jgi:mRNA interferase RelE/StbE
MAWRVELSPRTLNQLEKVDKSVSRRILKFLYERVEKLDDPRTIGGRLHGTMSEFWKYRVGDYRASFAPWKKTGLWYWSSGSAIVGRSTSGSHLYHLSPNDCALKMPLAHNP